MAANESRGRLLFSSFDPATQKKILDSKLPLKEELVPVSAMAAITEAISAQQMSSSTSTRRQSVGQRPQSAQELSGGAVRIGSIRRESDENGISSANGPSRSSSAPSAAIAAGIGVVFILSSSILLIFWGDYFFPPIDI